MPTGSSKKEIRTQVCCEQCRVLKGDEVQSTRGKGEKRNLGKLSKVLTPAVSEGQQV